MKERPILMSAPMVRALLEGRKTQTRRIVKLKPDHEVDRGLVFIKGSLDTVPSPYGKPGDRLWVKETFGIAESPSYADGQSDEVIIYRADGWNDDSGYLKWKPSIFMPRKFSRILLEITDVRVERLQDISEADAKAEGVEIPCGGWIGGYRRLWETINGSGSWDLNPWVWVIEFKRNDHAK